MKKMASLFTILTLLWTSFMTPFTYAQTAEMWISNVSINEELQNEELTDEIETYNTVGENPEDQTQFTLETSDDSSSLQMENRDLDVALQDLPQRSWTMFISWRDFNLRLKNLANDTEFYDIWENDENIIKFKKSNTPAPAWVTTTWLATDDSEYDITAWYDNWTIYYYTEADKIYLNPDSSYMFKNMIALTTIDTNKWDTSRVESMYDMFWWCISLKELEVSWWDTSNVVDMSGMFESCFNLMSLNVSNWDTSNVRNLEGMFGNCIALEKLNIENWDTSNVRYMDDMFNFCINLKELNLSNWNTSNVVNMRHMFDQCNSLETIYVSDKFVTTSLDDWYNMFQNNYSLIWWNGTRFNTDYTDADYANIDTDQNPWYFTNISGNTVIVKFFMNNWSDIDIQVIEKWNKIESVELSKDNAVFKWWYSDEWLTRKFNTSTAVNSNLKLYAKWECKPWYYNNKLQCIDKNKKIEHKWWVLKITDGENTVYIKDRNQWATQAKWQGFAYKFITPMLEKIWELNGDLLNIPFWWLYRYVINNLSEIAWGNMSTIWDVREYYDANWINVFKAIKSKNDEWNYTDSYGNYYYWWNDSGVSYKDFTFKEMNWYSEIWYYLDDILNWFMDWLDEYEESLFIDISESKIEWWFNWWKIWMEWEWWIQWNPNPCDPDKWEYLPTIEDWEKLMQVWWNINWREVIKSELELWEDSYVNVYVFGSWLDNLINWTSSNPTEILELLNLEITDDFMMPGAWWIVKIDGDLVKFILESQWLTEEEIDDGIENIIENYWAEYIRIPLLSPLRVASESWDIAWIYIGEAGIISVTNDIWAFANDIAAPVRCFVDESVWSKDEGNKENNYSGWWWRWGSSSKSATEIDTHRTADEQKDVENDKKTEVNENSQQNDSQNENKSETTAPQNNQWNIWSNSTSDEFQQAYNFAHSNGITTKNSVFEAKMNWNLTRIQMAKMLSQYAINVLGKEPDISKWTIKFNDVTNKMNRDYDNAVTLSYQLWIMWQNMPHNNFRPNDTVTRAEFATALSRMLYWIEDGKWSVKYYEPHIIKLYNEWIINKMDPKMKEKRWYVMIMLMRGVK